MYVDALYAYSFDACLGTVISYPNILSDSVRAIRQEQGQSGMPCTTGYAWITPDQYFSRYCSSVIPRRYISVAASTPTNR